MTISIGTPDGQWWTIDQLCTLGREPHPSPHAMRQRINKLMVADCVVTDEQLGRLIMPAGKPRGRSVKGVDQ